MSEFMLGKGMKVANMDGIHECYTIEKVNTAYTFQANISIENINKLIEAFYERLVEPCFLILEVPTNIANEERLRKSDRDPFHNDVYYLDGVSIDTLKNIIEKYGELFINDGSTNFGIASHISDDELFFSKYNITYIYTNNKESYIQMFNDLGIPYEDKIKTVYDNFSEATPGMSRKIYVNGQNIYDVIEQLKAEGLYLAETK